MARYNSKPLTRKVLTEKYGSYVKKVIVVECSGAKLWYRHHIGYIFFVRNFSEMQDVNKVFGRGCYTREEAQSIYLVIENSDRIIMKKDCIIIK